MRRALFTAIGLVIAFGLSAYAAAASGPKTRSFTETLSGAQITAKGNKSQSVYKTQSSLDGAGAAVQDITVSGSKFPLTGKSTTTIYFADGVAKSKATFKLSALDAKSVSKVSGGGSCDGGTGVHKHEQCSFTVTGAYNSKSKLARLKVRGMSTR